MGLRKTWYFYEQWLIHLHTFYQFHCGQKQVFPGYEQVVCIFKINKLDQHQGTKPTTIDSPPENCLPKKMKLLAMVCKHHQTSLCKCPSCSHGSSACHRFWREMQKQEITDYFKQHVLLNSLAGALYGRMRDSSVHNLHLFKCFS